MRASAPARLSILALFLGTVLAGAGCDCSGGTTPTQRCSTDRDCRGGASCIDGTCQSRTDGGGNDAGAIDATVPTDAWGRCTTSAVCGDGFECAGGRCCAVASVCGTGCCAASETCFAGACVVPGAECRTTADCASGEYCEPALGPGSSADGSVSADAGVPPADAGRACTSPTPRAGRCIALPPSCPTFPDGGVGDAGAASCTTHCEYHPEVGMLDAVVAWSWGQPTAPTANPNRIDVWSTPAVGRLYDANCDGTVDELDPPNVVFVSGYAFNQTSGLGACCQCTGNTPTECHRGALRALDGRTGETVWTLASPGASSSGFAATSVALGDVDRDGHVDVVAATGEGYVVLVDGNGVVRRTSDMPIPHATDDAFGWGGGFALADMDNDGFTEIAWGATVFHTTGGAITLAWTGAHGGAGGSSDALSVFADLNDDGDLELVAGNTVYDPDGTELWRNTSLPNGFPAVADMDADGRPDVIVVGTGTVTVVHGLDGTVIAGPFSLTGTGNGGPPTVADFDGDGRPEIGVAQQNFYSMIQLNAAGTGLEQVWRTANHDLSSSETGSTVFDFEGDGIAEVIYADECFLWVFDGPTGAVRFSAPTTSFTGTEASVVADVDGDGHAEILLPSNGADPTNSGWRCLDASDRPSVVNGVAWTPNTTPARSYRGMRMFRDAARTWVGTRAIWNQHSYHVTNVCVPGDGACAASEGYGAIPQHETASWTLDWVNNYRQNVQESGVFDAADATLSLEVRCTDPVVLLASLRNVGAAILPPGVRVDFFSVDAGGAETALGTVTSTSSVFPGAVTQLSLALASGADPMGTYRARIVNPASAPTFRECNEDNDTSADATGRCLQ